MSEISNFKSGSPRNDIQTSQNVCSECGFMHPPVSVCPMRKEKSNEGNEIPFDKLYPQFKAIILSQISKKGIKDFGKFFSHVIVSVTKAIETYEE